MQDLAQQRALGHRGPVDPVVGGHHRPGARLAADVFEFRTITAVAGVKHIKKFPIAVPAACTLVPEIDGLHVMPPNLGPGTHTLELGLEISPGVSIFGDLRVCTPLVWRSVRVTGNALGGVAKDSILVTPQAPVSPATVPMTRIPVAPPPPPLRSVYQPPPAPPATPPPTPAPTTPRPAPVPPRPPAPSPKPKPAATATRPSNSGRLLFILLAVVVLAVAGWFFFLRPGDFNDQATSPLPGPASAASALTALAISPDGKSIAEGTNDAAVRMIQVSGGDLKWRTARHDGPVRTIAFAPDGKSLASGADDLKVVIYNAATGDPDKILRDQQSAVDALAFSPDGKRLAAGLKDTTIRIWDVASQALLNKLTRHDGPVNAIAYSPDGGTLVSGGDDNKLIVWDPETGQDKEILRGFNGGLVALAITGKGEMIAAGFTDGAVRIWLHGNTMPALSRQTRGPIRGLFFSPNGKSLASVSGDATFTLWNTEDGDMRKTFAGFGDAAGVASFSPRASLLAAGGTDGALKLWRLQ